MDYMLMPFRRYFDFSGRSRRKEYWMFVLFIFIAVVVLSLLEAALGMGDMVGGLYGPLVLLFFLAIIIPSLAVQVRRFHDQDKSGWLVLLGFIPFVGSIIILVFMCLEGTPGPNEYGPDPKGRGDTETFE